MRALLCLPPLALVVLTLPHLSTTSTTSSSSQRPVIGILSQEVDRYDTKPDPESYIAASYVKFVESAGARVVPIMINQTEEEYKALFNSLNGILLPGGAVSIYSSGYASASKIFYDLAIEANQKGDFFPIWGTCLGFEQLAYLTAQKPIRVNTNTTSVTLPLNFTNDAKGSRMFQDFPDELMRALETEALTENSHMWSVSLKTYDTNDDLKAFYKVLSTNTDGRTEFISTWEGKGLWFNWTEKSIYKEHPYNYPIYGVQWHPEKNSFEWTRPHYAHSSNAVKVTFYFANFFVSEARKNLHSFESDEALRKLLIYQHSPTYTGDQWPFEQIYYF